MLTEAEQLKCCFINGCIVVAGEKMKISIEYKILCLEKNWYKLFYHWYSTPVPITKKDDSFSKNS